MGDSSGKQGGCSESTCCVSHWTVCFRRSSHRAVPQRTRFVFGDSRPRRQISVASLCPACFALSPQRGGTITTSRAKWTGSQSNSQYRGEEERGATSEGARAGVAGEGGGPRAPPLPPQTQPGAWAPLLRLRRPYLWECPSPWAEPGVKGQGASPKVKATGSRMMGWGRGAGGQGPASHPQRKAVSHLRHSPWDASQVRSDLGFFMDDLRSFLAPRSMMSPCATLGWGAAVPSRVGGSAASLTSPVPLTLLHCPVLTFPRLFGL